MLKKLAISLTPSLLVCLFMKESMSVSPVVSSFITPPSADFQSSLGR